MTGRSFSRFPGSPPAAIPPQRTAATYPPDAPPTPASAAVQPGTPRSPVRDVPGTPGPSLPPGGTRGQLPARTWRLAIPAGTQLLTMNQRLHFMAAAQRTKTLRETTGWLARAQRIPPLEAALIVCELTVPDRRRRDPANWMPTAKACVDGLVDAGVLLDDDFSRVRGPDMRLNVAAHRERYGPAGQFTVCVTELNGGEVA